MSEATVKKISTLEFNAPTYQKQNSAEEVVLIIDDSPDSINLLTATLKRQFKVVSLLSSEAVIKTIESCHPNIVLVDLNMPNVDGFEVIAQINRHPLLDDVAIIAMSATAEGSSRERLSKMGVVGFLNKPFTLSQITGQMRSIIEGLNSVISSDSEKRIWHDLFSMKKKKQKMNTLIQEAIEKQNKTIFLIWDRPENYLFSENNESINSDYISFVQIKPSFLPRFAYIHAFESVVDEFMEISGFKKNECDVVIEDPMRFLRHGGEEASLSQLAQLIREIEFKVNHVHILNVRSRESKYEYLSHQLVKIFIG